MKRIILSTLTIVACFSTAKAAAGSCSNYCTAATMADKCNHFGGSMENCMSWCNQYTTEMALGDDADTAGDTIGCRQYHLSVANSGDQAAMDLHCPHGGPTGGDVCGTHCDVYCGVQFQATCDSIYASAAECNTACAMLPVVEGQGGAYATATAGNSVQCRLYHLSAAAYDGAELHCPHADQDGSGVCVAEEPTELVTLQGSATLLGLSIADWNAAAIEAFKTRVASALGKTSSDITIVSVNPMTVEARRMLLNSGIKVDYAVAGYASSAEVNAAKVVLMDKEAEISTALQADAAFEGKLSGLSLDVAEDGGGDTTSSASRTTHIAWLLVVGYTAVAAYTA